MKILIATPLYPPEIGGPATYTKELSERLKKYHDIRVLAFTGKNPEQIDGVELVFVDKLKPLPYRLFRFFLAVLKFSKDVDIIYVQNAVAAGLPALLAAKIRRKPIVLKFVGDEAWERAYSSGKTKKLLIDFLNKPDGGFKSWIFIKIQKYVLRRVNILTTPSQYLGEEIIKFYKINPSKFVPNYNASKQSDDYKEDITLEADKKANQLITTARLVSWKGIDGIIKAVEILKDSIPNIKLIVAGDGPEMNNLKKKASGLNVDFVGKISRTETRNLRRESEIYVLNSLYEGLPHTVLSSFSAGIPVIATNIPGTDEAIYDRKTGLLVEPNNPEDLARKIKELLNNKELQKTLVNSAEKLLKEKFSWEAHVNRLLDIFESVVSKPNK